MDLTVFRLGGTLDCCARDQMRHGGIHICLDR